MRNSFGGAFLSYWNLEMCCGNLMFLVLLTFGVSDTLDSKEFQKNLPAKVIWAVEGKDAELPCDVTPALPGDNVNMIFWFKDNTGMPLYSLDSRGGPLSMAHHLTMGDDLGSRSYFIGDEEPSKARLRIQRVTEKDQGVFRCRVDFINSPTRNFQVNLTLVVQPSDPKIFDAEGREVKSDSTAGPFLEGHELFLSCQVTGGLPRPTLTWWWNNTLLDGVVDSSRVSHTTVNQLVIANTPRHLKGARLECRASSSEIAGDLVREVPVIVYLKPNKVKIVTPNDLLSVRKSQSLRCETSGSYPPAKLTWLLDGKPIRNADVTEEEMTTFTGSILQLNVIAEDDGKDLVCRVDNPRFPGGSYEDRRQIHVAFPPRVSVLMDEGARSPSVKEETDVVLRCETSARPTPHSYSWYHNNHLVPYNESAGILPMDHILTLRNIKQDAAGQYACSAMNSEGETYSATFQLNVQYTPHCRKGHERIRIGVLPHESIVVQCHVDSVPPVNRFSWTYNTSKGVFPVQGAKIQNKGNVSLLNLSPAVASSGNGLESLSCWATNDVGKQEVPCVFYVVPAEPPESPKSCIVRNATFGGLEVSCIAGKDGGLHQSFVLEVTDTSTSNVVQTAGITTLSDQGEGLPPTYRVLGERPVFQLLNLEPKKEYHLAVYAENAKGKSDPPVVLPNIMVDTKMSSGTLQDIGLSHPLDNPLNPTIYSKADGTNNQSLTLIIAGVTALALLLITGVVSVATVLACRRQVAARESANSFQRRRRPSSKPPSEIELSEAGFGEGFHRRSNLYRASMYGECEERISRLIEGPDLIMAPVSFSPSNNDY